MYSYVRPPEGEGHNNQVSSHYHQLEEQQQHQNLAQSWNTKEQNEK